MAVEEMIDYSEYNQNAMTAHNGGYRAERGGRMIQPRKAGPVRWGNKENSLYETVTLDTSPYTGPSKLDTLDDFR